MSKVKIRLPLFWKFTIAIVLVVAIFGSVNLYFLNSSLTDLSDKEIRNDGLSTASIIAERSISLILYDDLSTLDKMVSDNINADSRIAYIFVIDKSGKVLAHTFEQDVPSELIDLNKIEANNNFVEKRIKDINDPNKIIRHISVPILDGSLGTVNVGIYEDNFLNSIRSINRFFLSMVALFLFFGILGALIFSYIITKPISLLSNTAKELNLNQFKINTVDGDTKDILLPWQNPFGVHDEIDDLFSTFNAMIKRLEEAYTKLQNAQESLMQSEKIAAIGILSAGIAHEINNPIAGIQNCLKRISNDPANVQQNITYIELMDEAIHKIKKVVQELLNFSRKQDLIFTEIQINSVIENTLLLIAYELENSRISIVKNYPEIIPKIKGSFNHLEQVFLNLFINAIDAINEKKLLDEGFNGEITICIFTIKHYLSVKINDNGIGIQEDKLKQIFDPFYTNKKIKQGTGLGLAVSLNIIQQHKGKIKARNNDDGGITFSIYLPLK